MKILYLANLRLPTQKAHGIQVIKTCEAFADLGAVVMLAYPYRVNPDISGDIFNYYKVPAKFTAHMIWAPDFKLFYSLGTPIVLLKNVISSLILAWRAFTVQSDYIYSRDELPIFFVSFFRKNIVFEAHKFSNARKFFYRRFLKLEIPIITISQGLKNEFVSMGFNPENVSVVPDGVDLEKFNVNISKAEARHKVDLPEHAKIALYSGHLFSWKGVETLAEAARLMPDITGVFVGGMGADILKFRQKYGGLKNIIIAGHKSHYEIPYYLKSADVLVLPNSGIERLSSHYTSPLKLFEYMASNRPIVASNLPAIREALNDKNAFLVPSDNPGMLAEAIKRAMTDKEKATIALQDVNRYTWKNRAIKILNFIR